MGMAMWLRTEKCETNIRGIYVVGDLREKYARQIVIAAAVRLYGCPCCGALREIQKSFMEVCEAPTGLFK
jgi:thioredoxin reductase (NADPH)